MLPTDDRILSPDMKYSMCWFPNVWSPFTFRNELSSRASLVVTISLFFLLPLRLIPKQSVFLACLWALLKWQQNIWIFLQVAFLLFLFNNMLQRSVHADIQLIYFQSCINSSLWLFHNLSNHFRLFGLLDSCFCLYVCFCYYQPVCHIHSYAWLMMTLC